MPRLRHMKSGAVISCSQEKAARMGDEWQPVTEKKPAAKKAPAKKSAKPADND